MLESSTIALLQLSSVAALSREKSMAMVKNWYIEQDKESHWKEIVDRTMLAGLHHFDPNVFEGFRYTWQYPLRQDGNIHNVYVDYMVNFGAMTQKNETTEMVRKLLWSLSTGVEDTSVVAEGCKWLVKVQGQGLWCEVHNEMVTSALLKEDKTITFECGRYDYILDLKAMKQTNIETGKERAVVFARR